MHLSLSCSICATVSLILLHMLLSARRDARGDDFAAVEAELCSPISAST